MRLLILLLALVACTPKISSEISLPFVPVREGLADVGKGAMVFVDEVKDARKSAAIGMGPNGPIEATGNVPATVRETLEVLFRRSGFSVTDSAPTVLQVELKEWKSVYSRGELEATAALTLQVYDPGNKLAYTGSYQGSASIEGGGIDDRSVKDSLATALSEAVDQISRDKQLLTLLASF